jgi:hypothetical protein
MKSKLIFSLTLFAAISAQASVTYSLRDAYFFGGTPGPSREILESGFFDLLSNESLAASYSTGGGTPTTFNGLAQAQGSPFKLSTSNSVSAAASTPLNFNLPTFGATNTVSIVGSTITEYGLLATGSTGVGYFLPTFRVFGTFNDSHSSAFASAAICAGIGFCPLTGLDSSTGGQQNTDLLYTPQIGQYSEFTFDTPFDFFFFLNNSIRSNSVGTLAAGDLSANLYLEIVGYAIVDANGQAIQGASLTSEVFNPTQVPEPGSMALLGLGAIALMLHRRRSAK